jgi:beta-galactosidase
LLKDSTIKVRSKDERFIAAYSNYIHQLSKQLIPLLVTHGGNILMLQIENEYGSYSNDKSYLELNRKLFREAGLDAILFTCDGADKMSFGYLPGYLPAVNGLEDPAETKKLINKYHEGKGPYYIAEWYPGWFDQWGKPHAKGNANKEAAKLDHILSENVSVNMYVFHGGTTRGFMNGANMNIHEPYAPQVSSYDYDAPLDEAGNPTEKYFKFREIIAKHLPAGLLLPAVPDRKKTIAIGDIKLTGYAGIFDNLPKPVSAKTPLSFEDLNQGYGFVLYRSVISSSKEALLKIHGLRDYAIVYINGEQKAVLDRRLEQDSVFLNDVPENSVLDIWVENNGRINYGPYLTDNRKGIIQKVTINGADVYNWKMYGFPFNSIENFKFKSNVPKLQPGFSKGYFTLNEPADTYLDMRSFGKGFVFLNGHNLGKFWQIGPQQTLYVPACWLKNGINEIAVFDELKQGHTLLNTVKDPILDKVTIVKH